MTNDLEENYEKAKALADDAVQFFERLQKIPMVIHIEIVRVTYNDLPIPEIGKEEELSSSLCRALEITIENHFPLLMGRVALDTNTAAIASLDAKIKAESFIENHKTMEAIDD